MLTQHRPLPIASSVGYEIHEFLAWEALLLDNHRYDEWTGLLTTDLVYFSPGKKWNHQTLLDAARQATREHASLASNTRRLVSNVIISPANCSREFSVNSYVLLMGARSGENESMWATVERRDCLRRTAQSFQISRREIRFIQSAAEPRLPEIL
jgi:3-phenylpropionate/cinnamic acid dioxygenase small subunit